jgi:hypothetical protein
VEWIHLSQDWDQWQSLVNLVMNIWFHKRQGIYGLAEQLGIGSRILLSGVSKLHSEMEF